MTPAQREQVAALAKCRFKPAGWEKRFLRDLVEMPEERELSPRQAQALVRMAHAQRVQIGRCLVEECALCVAAAARNAPGTRVLKRRLAQAEAQRLLEEHNERWSK